MKLLVMLPASGFGGVEKYALKVATAAIGRGYESHVAFPKDSSTTKLIQDFTRAHVEYHPININESFTHGITYPFRMVWLCVKTFLLLIKLHPDQVIIVAPWFNRCLGSILACAVMNVPTIIRFGLIPNHPVQLRGWRKRLYSWAKSRRQAWVAVSDHDRNILSKTFQFAPEDIERIYNGTKFSNPNSSNGEDEIAQVRKELGITEKDTIVLTVARIHPQKGYQDVLPILPRIIEFNPYLKFLWVGENQMGGLIEKEISALNLNNNVILLGHRPDVPKLLQAADLFLFPTRLEGHPSALIEAMAFRLPVISSDACSIPEMIVSGEHGLLFRVGDREQLLEQLRWALTYRDDMKSMAEAANKLVLNCFCEEDMWKNTFDLINRLQLDF